MKKQALSIFLLASLLFSCNQGSDTNTTDSGKQNSDQQESAVLNNSMFQKAGNNSITYFETIKAHNASNDLEAYLLTKFSDGRYYGSIIDDEESRNVLNDITYYNKNGKVTYTTHPDKHNKVSEQSSSIRWENSVYVNLLGMLTKDSFQYVSKDSFGISTYTLKQDAISNKTTKSILDRIYDSATSYYHGGTTSKYGGDTLSKMDITINKDGILGFTMRYAEKDSTGRKYTDLEVSLEDIGTTSLTEEDVCPTAYTYEDSYKAQYNALAKALAEMKTYNYKIDLQIYKEKDLFQHSGAVFNESGYSGYDEILSNSKGSYTYYGIHKRKDGRYEKYQGNTPSTLKGKIFRSSAHQGLMKFDFSPEIFEVDKEKSTTDKYVFHIRKDYMKNNYIRDITEDMTYDEYATYANGLELTVENNHLTNFNFHFSDNFQNDYTFNENITEHGENPLINEVYADFTTYQEYQEPTSFKDIEVGIMSISTGDVTGYENGEVIIRSYLFSASAFDVLRFPLVGDSSYYYESATYIPAYIVNSALYLFFDEGDEAIATVFKKVLKAINSCGYSLTTSDNVTATQTISDKQGNTYEVSLSYESGHLALCYTTPMSIE